MDYEIKNGVAIIPEGTKEIGNKAFNKLHGLHIYSLQSRQQYTNYDAMITLTPSGSFTSSS